jgi:hypothetical protein
MSEQCSCGSSAVANNKLVKWTTARGLFAALGVCAACCLLAFVLISLGVAGAWVGTLDSLARYTCSRKLEKIPGIGPLAASALVASIADAKSFDNGQQVSAWFGLVPRQCSSGGPRCSA